MLTDETTRAKPMRSVRTLETWMKSRGKTSRSQRARWGRRAPITEYRLIKPLPRVATATTLTESGRRCSIQEVYIFARRLETRGGSGRERVPTRPRLGVAAGVDRLRLGS